MNRFEVIIVGGGLAGLTSAIHLALKGRSVCLFEKEAYPHHKVCGEYISNEIVPYLQHLGIFLEANGAKTINILELSTVKGESLRLELPLGGKGISRYAFDHLLFERAKALGVAFVFQTVRFINYQENTFQVGTNKSVYSAQAVIGSYGKRDLLDKRLKRSFMQKKSTWLGVKCHYVYDDFPEDEVALHNFVGGYGGLSKTETNAVNFCYLASYETFKRYKNIHQFNKEVVSRNPFLGSFLEKAIPIFDEPMTIAQISFDRKEVVENHILMCGDAAGLIHPLCGNGMAMAIHSAKIATELLIRYFQEEGFDRILLEKEYRKQWNSAFANRLRTGKYLQSLLLSESFSRVAMTTAARSSWLLRKLVTQTHGKPIVC